MNALVQLHPPELSPKLAATAANIFSYPEFALGLETVCHLLAFWPVQYSWALGLYSIQSSMVFMLTSLLAFDLKEVAVRCVYWYD
ncbi:hypothetical protein Dimus_007155 [Dionaea muscipula]